MKTTLALVLCAVLLTFTACGGGDRQPRIEDVLEQLEPGTTLHTVEVKYRRYGPAEDIYAQYFPEYGPETLRNETWMEFGTDGKLVGMRSESRREDGSIYRRTRLDGNDWVVEDENGVEQSRLKMEFDEFTVEAFEDAYARAIDETVAALEEHPDAATITLRSQQARVIEERREFTWTPHPASASSYTAPYLYDLEPVEEIRRSYVALDGSAGYRSEIAVVGENGTETVVESTDHLVIGVLRG